MDPKLPEVRRELRGYVFAVTVLVVLVALVVTVSDRRNDSAVFMSATPVDETATTASKGTADPEVPGPTNEAIPVGRARRIDSRDIAVLEAVLAVHMAQRKISRFAVDRLSLTSAADLLEEAPSVSECESLGLGVETSEAIAQAVDESAQRSWFIHDLTELSRSRYPILLVDEGDFIWEYDLFFQAKVDVYLAFSAVGYSIDGRFAAVFVGQDLPGCGGFDLIVFEFRAGVWVERGSFSRGVGSKISVRPPNYSRVRSAYGTRPPKIDASTLLKRALGK